MNFSIKAQFCQIFKNIRKMNGFSVFLAFSIMVSGELLLAAESPSLIEVAVDSIGQEVGPDTDRQNTGINGKTTQPPENQEPPDRPVGLSLIGKLDEIIVNWDVSKNEHVSEYEIFASVSPSEEFESVGKFEKSPVIIKISKKRYQRFKVRAISHSGLLGSFSDISDNLFEAGYQMFLSGDFPSAIDEFLNIEETGIKNSTVLEYLIRSLLADGQYNFAFNVSYKLSELEETATLTNTLQADALYRAGQFTRAGKIVNSMSAKERLKPEIQMLCGLINLQLNQRRVAAKCLSKILVKKPENIQARLLLLRTVELPKQKKSLSRQVKWLLQFGRTKRDVSALVGLGKFNLDRGRTKSAIYYFRQAGKIDKKNIAMRSGLIAAALKQKDYSLARGTALQMITTPSQQFQGYYQLGKIMMRQSRPGEAVMAYRKALKLEPKNIEVKLALAKAYNRLGNTYQSRQMLNAILITERYNAKALLDLAVLESAVGKNVVAAGYLNKGLRHHPNQVEAHALLAGILDKLGRTYQASVHIKEALQIDSDNKKYVHLLADLYYKQARFDEALINYKKLLRKSRNSVSLNLRVGSIYYQKGFYIRARKSLEKVVRLNRKNEQAHFLLANVYRETGLYKFAIRSAKSALAIKSNTENKLLLNSIYKKKRQAQTRKEKPLVFIKSFVSYPVFTTGLRAQEKIRIGKLQIANNSHSDIHDVSLKIFIGDYPNSGFIQKVDALKAKSTTDVVLMADLSSWSNRREEDKNVDVDLEFEFSGSWGSQNKQNNQKTYLLESSQTMKLYGNNAIDWQLHESVSSFISRDYKTIQQFVGSPASRESGLPAYLSESTGVFSLLTSYGFGIHSSVSTLSSLAENKTNRYLQTPLETLIRRKGNVAEVTMLAASGLLARNIRVALIDASNPVLLLDSDVPWAMRSDVSADDDMLVNHGGRVWIPLDMKEMNNGFIAMWKSGANRLKKLTGKPYRFIDLVVDPERDFSGNDILVEMNYLDEQNIKLYNWSHKWELEKLRSFISEKRKASVIDRLPNR